MTTQHELKFEPTSLPTSQQGAEANHAPPTPVVFPVHDKSAMKRKEWTDLASFYELDGRPGFVIDSLGLAKHLDLTSHWLDIAPKTLADWGQALCQNLNLNVWLEEHGLIGPPP